MTPSFGANDDAACLYAGEVVHTRLVPKPHKLSYAVFTLLIDLDRIEDAAAAVGLFSYNRRNLVSLYDEDLGDRTSRPIADRIRELLGSNQLAHCAHRLVALTYPRVLGHVFNPLSVYYCYQADGRLGAVIHEVTNTYGERKSYVLPVGDLAGTAPHGVIAQSCGKEMSVSPFTSGAGTYDFRLSPPGGTVTVGVALRDDAGPILKTHFRGDHVRLTSTQLIRQFRRTPFLAERVLGAIHLEAFRLWWKGIPIVRRHRSPKYSVSVQSTVAD